MIGIVCRLCKAQVPFHFLLNNFLRGNEHLPSSNTWNSRLHYSVPCNRNTSRTKRNPSRGNPTCISKLTPKGACGPCGTCPSQFYQSVKCTSTTNVTCSPCTVCPSYQVSPCMQTQNTVCSSSPPPAPVPVPVPVACNPPVVCTGGLFTGSPFLQLCSNFN